MIKYPLKPKVGDIVKCIESEEFVKIFLEKEVNNG